MTIYYADFDLTTGNNDGSNAANAWQTLQDALDGTNGTMPAAGDTILCKGTDNITSSVTFNAGNAGDSTSGTLNIIGVNSSWTNDGTQAKIDAGGNATDCINLNGVDYLHIENLEAGNTDKASENNGVTYGGSSYYNVFINCYFHDCYDGFYGYDYTRYNHFFRCRFSNNARTGCYSMRDCDFFFCRFDNNVSKGADGYSSTFFECIAHDNGGDGFYNYGGKYINCASYGNSGDGFQHDYVVVSSFVNCRSVNNSSYGFNKNSRINPMMYLYGQNNTSGFSDITDHDNEITNNGTSTLVESGSDTDGGFEDTSIDDFRIASGATYFSEEVEIP